MKFKNKLYSCVCSINAFFNMHFICHLIFLKHSISNLYSCINVKLIWEHVCKTQMSWNLKQLLPSLLKRETMIHLHFWNTHDHICILFLDCKLYFYLIVKKIFYTITYLVFLLFFFYYFVLFSLYIYDMIFCIYFLIFFVPHLHKKQKLEFVWNLVCQLLLMLLLLFVS